MGGTWVGGVLGEEGRVDGRGLGVDPPVRIRGVMRERGQKGSERVRDVALENPSRAFPHGWCIHFGQQVQMRPYQACSPGRVCQGRRGFWVFRGGRLVGTRKTPFDGPQR